MALLSTLLMGCLGSEPWGAPTGLSFDGGPDFQLLALQGAMAWNDALRDACGFEAFHRDQDTGRHVRLVGHLDDGALGEFDGDEIRVLDGTDDVVRASVVHELGHALGVGHVDVQADPLSVMHPAVNGYLWRPTDGDVRLAAMALGCAL